MTPQVKKKRESLISVIIVFVLLLIVAGVSIKQSYYSESRFGFNQQVSADSGAVSAGSNMPSDGVKLAQFVPQKFQPMGESGHYNPEKLYEKINGKAPLYLDAGFKMLYTLAFANESDEDQWAEVYLFDMGKFSNAFSVFSVQRRSSGLRIEGLENAYKTENALFACVGKYYVEIVGSSADEELMAGMGSVLKELATEFGEKQEKPAEIIILEFEGMIPDSVRVYAESGMGFDKFRNLYAADYNVDGIKVTAFVVKAGSVDAAAGLAQDYKNYLLENGATGVEVEDMPDSVFDFYGMIEVVLSESGNVMGVHEADDIAAAKELAKRLATNVKEVGK